VRDLEKDGRLYYIPSFGVKGYFAGGAAGIRTGTDGDHAVPETARKRWT